MKKKKITVPLFLLFFCSRFLFAFDNGFFIGAEPVYSLQNGILQEYVIAYDKGSNQNVTMSRLDWQLENISYLGGRINTGWKFISLSAEYSKAFSKTSGIMEDYDWLDYIENTFYYYRNPLLCTTKSISENTLNDANNFEIVLKFDINPFFDLVISPFAGFNYSTYSFSGRNAYGWYGNASALTNWKTYSYDSTEAYFYDAGTLGGIDYKRDTSDFFIGASIGCIFFDRVSFGASVSVSPYFNVQSLDFHHISYEDTTTGKYYYDIMTSYFNKYNFGAYAECVIVKGLSVDVNFNYYVQDNTPGVTYFNYKPKFNKTDKSETTSNSTGRFWVLKGGIKYTF